MNKKKERKPRPKMVFSFDYQPKSCALATFSPRTKQKQKRKKPTKNQKPKNTQKPKNPLKEPIPKGSPIDP